MRIVDEYLDKITMETLLSGVDYPGLELSPSSAPTIITSKSSCNKKRKTPSSLPLSETEGYGQDEKGNIRFYYRDCLVQVFPSTKNSTVRLHVTGLTPKPQNNALDYSAYEDTVRTVSRELVERLGLAYRERTERWRSHEWKVILPLPCYIEIVNLCNLLSQGYAIKYYCRNRVHIVPRQGIHNRLDDARSRYVSMTDLQNKLVAWAYTPTDWKNEDGEYRGFYVKSFFDDQATGEVYRISIEHNGVSLKAIDQELRGHGLEGGEAVQVEIERFYDRPAPCYADDRLMLIRLLDQSIVMPEGGETMNIDDQLKVVSANANTMLSTLLNSRDNSVEKMHQEMTSRFDDLGTTIVSTAQGVHAIRSATDVAYRADQNNRERFLWYLTSRGGRASSTEVATLFSDLRMSPGSLRDLVSALARSLEADGKILVRKGSGTRPSSFELRQAGGPDDERVVRTMLGTLKGYEDKRALEVSAPEFFAEVSQQLNAPFELCRRLFIEHIHANPSYNYSLVGKVIRFLANQERLKHDLDETRRERDDQDREQGRSGDRLLAQVRGSGTGIPPISTQEGAQQGRAFNRGSGTGADGAQKNPPCNATGRASAGLYRQPRLGKEEGLELVKTLNLAMHFGKTVGGLWSRAEEIAQKHPTLATFPDFQRLKGKFDLWEADVDGTVDEGVLLYEMKALMGSLTAKVEHGTK